MILCEQWAQQYNDNNNGGVKFVTAHPGWTDTPAVDEAFGDNKKYLEPLREPWQGAEGIAWLTACSSSNANDLQSGALYLDRKVQRKHLAGAFMTEGSFTKNSDAEIQTFMENLKKASGL